MAQKSDNRTFLKHLLLTLLVGLIGGLIFNFLQLPLAWVLGAMFLTTVAALAGAPMVFSSRLREVMACILGTLLGSAFTPEIAGEVMGWWDGVLVSTLSLLAMLIMGTCYFRLIGKFDPPTSYFCATPGGLSSMSIIGEEFGGDPRMIPLVHAIRIVLVVFLIPAYLVFGEGMTLPDRNDIDGLVVAMSIRDIALVTVFALAGVIFGKLIRLPSATLIGPMLFTSAAFMAGWVEGRPPFFLIILAQLIIGASIGPRFVGLNVRVLAKPIMMAALSAATMLIIAIVVANLFSDWVGVSMVALLLALAPGGLAEMTLIALTLDVNTAFVGALHVARILFVVLAAPLAFRWLGLSKGRDDLGPQN
jgi:membrane AbrB-like protein